MCFNIVFLHIVLYYYIVIVVILFVRLFLEFLDVIIARIAVRNVCQIKRYKVRS